MSISTPRVTMPPCRLTIDALEQPSSVIVSCDTPLYIWPLYRMWHNESMWLCE